MVALDERAKRHDWDDDRTVLVGQCSTSTTYHYMGTTSEVPRIGTYIDITLIWRMVQEVWSKWLRPCAKLAKVAHRPTAVLR